MKKLKLRSLVVFVWIVVIVSGGLIIANAKPIVVGYSTYKRILDTNYTIEDYGAKISEINERMEAAESSNEDFKTQLESANSELTSLDEQINELREKLRGYDETKQEEMSAISLQYEMDIGELNTKTDILQAKLERAEGHYDSIVKSSARSICCKQKVDNPKISYYSVKSSKIVCLEQGNQKLEC